MKNTKSVKSEHWSLNNSKDNRVREVMPQLRSGRKFRAQEEIEKSQAILAFEEIRGPIQVDRQESDGTTLRDGPRQMHQPKQP